jgi:Secretion system C-terminal sorting domain
MSFDTTQMKLTITFTLLLMVFCLAAQDTILIGYPNANMQIPSLITEFTITDREELVMVQANNDSGGGVLITDSIGRPLVHKYIGEVEGFTNLFLNNVFQKGDSLVFLGLFDKGDIRYYLTVYCDMRATNFHVIDTLQFPKAVYVANNSVKYLAKTGLYETFAYVEDTLTRRIIDHVHIKFDTEFHFQGRKSVIGLQVKNRPVFEFTQDPNTALYGLSLFPGPPYYLVNEKDSVVLETESLETTFLQNNITYTARHQPNGCTENGGVINCFCRSSFVPANAIQRLTHLKMRFESDSIIVLEKHFLNTTPSMPMSLGELMKPDRNGDYVAAGVNGLTLSSQGTVPNKLNVFKYSQTDYSRMWGLIFETDASFVIWDMNIGRNNDIYLVGHAQNIYEPDALSGFMFKISPNGMPTVSTLPEINHAQPSATIFPNPSNGPLNIKTDLLKPSKFTMFDADGKLVLSRLVSHSDIEQLEMNLPAGIYFWTLDTDKGMFSGQWIKE